MNSTIRRVYASFIILVLVFGKHSAVCFDLLLVELFQLIDFVFVSGSHEAFSIKPNVTKTVQCEFFNGTVCPENDKTCKRIDECQTPESDKRMHCYALWVNNTSTGPTIKLKVSPHFHDMLYLRRSQL